MSAGPHLDHRTQSTAPPGQSTRVQLEPPARHCPTGMQPPPPEAGGPAAGGKQPAGGSRLLPAPVPISSGERTGHQQSWGCRSLLSSPGRLASQPPADAFTPTWPLYQCEWSPWGGAESRGSGADLQARLAPAALRGQGWPAPLSERTATQQPVCTAGSHPGWPVGGGLQKALSSALSLSPDQGSCRQQPHGTVFSLWPGGRW